MAHSETDAGQARARPARPWLRVVRGAPTDEELAAVVAVLAPRTAANPPAPAPRPLWRDRTALVHAPLMPGRGVWRASGQATHR